MTTAAPASQTTCAFVHTTGAIEWVCIAPPHGEPTFTMDGLPEGHVFRNRSVSPRATSGG